MEIVIEYVLIENFLINLIVMKTTALILHQKAHFIVLSSFFSACVTVAIPALGLSIVGNFMLEIGLLVVILSWTFKLDGRKKIRKFLQNFACYYLCAFLYGGAFYFFLGFIGQSALIVVLLAVLGTFALVKIIFKMSKKRQNVENFCFDVEITLGQRIIQAKGFLDSGNLLFDPVTGRAVTLINLKTFERLCDDVCLEDVLTRSENLKKLRLSHFINVHTLGAGDKILVFQADSLCFGQNKSDKPILGLTFKSFNSLHSDVILTNAESM